MYSCIQTDRLVIIHVNRHQQPPVREAAASSLARRKGCIRRAPSSSLELMTKGEGEEGVGDAGAKETPSRAATFFIMIILCPVTACAASPHRVPSEHRHL